MDAQKKIDGQKTMDGWMDRRKKDGWLVWSGKEMDGWMDRQI